MSEIAHPTDVPTSPTPMSADAGHALAEVQRDQRAASPGKAANPGNEVHKELQPGKVSDKFGKVTITQPETWGSRTFFVDKEGTAEYTVHSGDTLGLIAREVLMHKNPKAGEPKPNEIQAEVDRLAKDNGIANPSLIKPDQKIIVRSGEAKVEDSTKKSEAPSAYHGEPVIKRKGEKISEITRPDGDSVTISYTSGGSALEIHNKSGRYVKDDEGWKYTDDKTGKTTRYKDVQVDQETGNIAITKLDGEIRTHTPEGATVVQTADKKVASIVYPDNKTTEIKYRDGQPTQIVEPDASRWIKRLDGTWSHFKNGEVIEQSDVIKFGPNGDLRFEDKKGFGVTRCSDRSTIETRSDGSSIERAPDGLIKGMSHADSQGKQRPVEVVYDEHRQVKQVAVMEGTWSKAGSSWKFTDTNGKQTATADDIQVKPDGDIVIRDKGSVNTFGLDGSKMTGVIQADGHQRISKITHPDGKCNTFEYDDKTGQIQAIVHRDGVRTERKGDHWETSYPGGKKETVTWYGTIGVTDEGDLIAIDKSGLSVVRSRDGSKTVMNTDKSQVTTDMQERVTRVVYPDGHRDTMEYDQRDGTLTGIKNSATGSEWRRDKDGWNKYDMNHTKVSHFDGQVTVSKDGDIVDTFKNGRKVALKPNGKSEFRS